MDRKGRGRFLNNPFPREPSSLGLVQGKLFCIDKFLGKHSWLAGEGFELHWKPEKGGSLSIHHVDEPNRSIWSTLPGTAFVSAALGRESIEESRGSFAFHEKVEIICSQQTVEEIYLLYPQEHNTDEQSNPSSGYRRDSKWSFLFEDGSREGEDADGVKCVSRGACVVIAGCLYSDPKLASIQLKKFSASKGDAEGPIYTFEHDQDDRGCFNLYSKQPLAGVRYWLAFYEKRDHHLGFIVKLGQPWMLPDAFFVTRNKSNVDHGSLLDERDCRDEQESAALQSQNQPQQLRQKKPLSALSGVRFRAGLRKRKDAVNFTRRMASYPIGMPAQEATCCDTDWKTAADEHEQLYLRLPRFNKVQLTYVSEKSERFYGFGEQFSFFDMKGRRVPILVQEQGLGRGDQPITAAANLAASRAGGNWFTTYAPAPYYLTTAMRSLFLEGYEYSVFDLRRQDRVQVQVTGAAMRGRILHGQTLLELIKHYTGAIGRMKALPDWILEGAIIGIQGGTDTVKRIWKQLQEHDVPIAAFWLQDWVGQRTTSVGSQLWWNWEVDTDHYPGWNDLVKELQSENICTMTYLNPFLVPTDEKMNRREDLFAEARNRGLFVKDEKGEPYMISNTSFDSGLMDLTNPATSKWFKRIMREMVQTGVKGWMADFGEALPFDCFLFAGKPAVAHNKYPELWAELNREFVEEWEKEQQELREPKLHEDESFKKQLVFFVRAGYRASPKLSTLFWEGDQMVSWQRHDGLKSAVVGLLSSGISGFSFNHSDIGGYTTVDLAILKYKRSEELFGRWVELNAFSTIFRTHEGNVPSANVQFYSNERTFLHFARFAKIYKAWNFYRKELVKEAAATGIPVVRHMVLHYPEDKYVQKITYQQFLVGSEILVVPVLDKGRTRVKAYFPLGEVWQHVWTGTLYNYPKGKFQNGIKAWIQAPIGYPAIFIKQQSSIGLKFVENLAKEEII
ncbi:hypothetical protein O6H91_23G022100 [Diphasiastrum complanatum]|uniref:Uncharacterized protein n=2 Tax=Diphasiastrum complanatum TaxID=34168 RepID=A0ACC2A8W3_DIPCM|nr:hypothetical protein O6H91_23G022100 [Diphasiastrum complanatum]